jgi:hypothetical protein
MPASFSVLQEGTPGVGEQSHRYTKNAGLTQSSRPRVDRNISCIYFPIIYYSPTVYCSKILSVLQYGKAIFNCRRL